MKPVMSPAKAAMAELKRRMGLAQRAVDESQWSAGLANTRLMPWVAIAIRSGADVPPCRELLAEQAEKVRQSWPDLPAQRIEALARALAADDLAAPDVWKPALVAARDTALNKFTGPNPPSAADTDQAIALTTLTIHFRLPGWRPPSMLDQLQERNAA